MNWYIQAIKKSFDFTGRAGRPEYLVFTLIHWLICLLLLSIDIAAGTSYEGGYALISGIYSILTLIPCISIVVRRLHDINCSGWWSASPLIPLLLLVVAVLKQDLAIAIYAAILFIGFVIALSVVVLLKGTPGDNQYGPDPADD